MGSTNTGAAGHAPPIAPPLSTATPDRRRVKVQQRKARCGLLSSPLHTLLVWCTFFLASYGSPTPSPTFDEYVLYNGAETCSDSYALLTTEAACEAAAQWSTNNDGNYEYIWAESGSWSGDPYGCFAQANFDDFGFISYYSVFLNTYNSGLDCTFDNYDDPSYNDCLCGHSYPTHDPTLLPTLTHKPTSYPTLIPSPKPTEVPTLEPTFEPSLSPSTIPTFVPTREPTFEPSLSPSTIPTFVPTLEPTFEPSLSPSTIPTFVPSLAPSLQPSSTPTLPPPTPVPTLLPTPVPTSGLAVTPLDRSMYKCGEETVEIKWATNGEYESSCAYVDLTLKCATTTTNSGGNCEENERATGFTTISGLETTGSNNPYLWSPDYTAYYCIKAEVNGAYYMQLSCTESSEGTPTAYYKTENFNLTLSASDCEAGEYFETLLNGCQPCPAGFYQNDTGSFECSSCESGTYQSATGQTSCIDCPVGKYTDGSESSECDSCPSGTYSDTIATVDCTSCESGTYQSATGSTSCVECPVGKYNDGSEPSECADCPSGSYSDTKGTVNCLTCQAGRWVNTTGATACIDCGRGRYLYDNGGLAKLHKDEAQCKSCEAGKYSNVTSAQTCSQCSSIDEFLYSSEGSTGCMECHKHYYRTSVIECHQDGSSTTSCDEASAVANCTKCPTGLDCGKPNSKLESLDLEAQYWRAGPKATKIYKCHDSVQCPGKRNSTDEYCGKGYRGPLCSICRNSFFKTYSSMCERCSPLRILASTSAWIVALVSILMLLPMLIVRRFGGLSNLRASMGSNITHVDWWLVALRITYFKIQVISQYSEVQHVNWPKPFQFTVDVMSAVSLNFAKWWTANSCLIPYDAFAYVRIATLTPLLMALATFAVFAARAVGGLRERMKKAWTRGRKIFTQAMDIIHTLICCLIFQTFECKRFENVGEDDEVQKYLKSDLQQVNCSLDNPYYRAFYIYAVVMVVVYVGIIPVVMLLDKRENRERDFSSGLLWLNPYKEKFWWFDSFDRIYRLTMCGLLVVVLPTRLSIRIIASAYISLLYLLILVVLQPYASRSHNNVMGIGQFFVVTLVFTSYVLKEKTLDSAEKEACGYCLFFAALVLFFGIFFGSKKRLRLHSLLKHMQPNPPEKFDPLELSRVHTIGSNGVVQFNILRCLETCFRRIEKEPEFKHDWAYIMRMLIPLRAGVDGASLWHENVPPLRFKSAASKSVDAFLQSGHGRMHATMSGREAIRSSALEVFGSTVLRHRLVLSSMQSEASPLHVMAELEEQGGAEEEDEEQDFFAVCVSVSQVERTSTPVNSLAQEEQSMNNEGEILKDGESRSDDAVDAMLHELALTSDEWMRKPTVFDAGKMLARASLHRVKSEFIQTVDELLLDKALGSLQEHLPRNRAVSLRDRQAPPVAPPLRPTLIDGRPAEDHRTGAPEVAPPLRPTLIDGRPAEDHGTTAPEVAPPRRPTLIDGQPASESDVTEAPEMDDDSFQLGQEDEAIDDSIFENIFKNLIRGMSTTKAELTPARQEFQDALLDAVKTNTTGARDEFQRMLLDAVPRSRLFEEIPATTRFDDDDDDGSVEIEIESDTRVRTETFDMRTLKTPLQIRSAEVEMINPSTAGPPPSLELKPAVVYDDLDVQTPLLLVSSALGVTFLCATAQDMVETVQRLYARESDRFRILQVKNSLRKREAPFNIRLRISCKLGACHDPVTTEVQIELRKLHAQKERVLLLKEFIRAKHTEDLLVGFGSSRQ